jgi:hypothetical protein
MRFHLKNSWLDEDEDETEEHEYELILNDNYTFTMREQTNYAERDHEGTWSVLDYKDTSLKLRLTDHKNWNGFQDITLNGSLENPVSVTGAIFMHSIVPFTHH